MRYAMNDERRLVGREVTISVNGATVSGRLCSLGNHGVVLDVNGTKRTFSGLISMRPAATTAG